MLTDQGQPMCHQTKTSLDQIMVYHPCGYLTQCWLAVIRTLNWGKTSVKYGSKYEQLHWRKLMWKCGVQPDGHFVSASICSVCCQGEPLYYIPDCWCLYCTEFILWNMRYILILYHIATLRYVIEILFHTRQGSVYPAKSIPWFLVTWALIQYKYVVLPV